MFKPELNKKSLELANAQLRIIQDEFSKNSLQIDHKDLLIKKGELYQEHNR